MFIKLINQAISMLHYMSNAYHKHLTEGHLVMHILHSSK